MQTTTPFPYWWGICVQSHLMLHMNGPLNEWDMHTVSASFEGWERSTCPFCCLSWKHVEAIVCPSVPATHTLLSHLISAMRRCNRRALWQQVSLHYRACQLPSLGSEPAQLPCPLVRKRLDCARGREPRGPDREEGRGGGGIWFTYSSLCGTHLILNSSKAIKGN